MSRAPRPASERATWMGRRSGAGRGGSFSRPGWVRGGTFSLSPPRVDEQVQEIRTPLPLPRVVYKELLSRGLS